MIQIVIYPTPHRFDHRRPWEAQPETPWEQLDREQQLAADRLWERGPFRTTDEAATAARTVFGDVPTRLLTDVYIPPLACQE
jgi:hypothetical protein